MLWGADKKSHLTPPDIYSVEEAKKLLSLARNNEKLELLPAVVFGLFCGLRTSEIQNLEWKHVHINDHDEPFVEIPTGLGKGAYNRNIPIPQNALEWLEICPKNHDKVTWPNSHELSYYNKRFKKLKDLAAFKSGEKQNAMRHSYASYLYSLTASIDQTKLNMGHTESDLLFKHYRALTSKKDAVEYFNITPQSNKNKIIEFGEFQASVTLD